MNGKEVGLALALLCAALTAKAAGDRFPGVEKLMSDEEFRAAGLDQLSPAQLEALDRWLVRYTAGDAEVLQQSNEEVRDAKKDYEVRSRIVGDFDGWSGGTVFRLENGQVWDQRLDGRYFYDGPPNPEVVIDRNWLGFYRLTVVPTGKRIGVSPRD